MRLAKFSVNATRYDPYKNFKFRIKVDGKTIAGLNKMSALRKKTEVIEYREGADPSVLHKIPGRTRFSPITLEAGLTHDLTFENWANLVNNLAGDAAMSLKNFRKDIIIEVLNEQGAVALAYKVHRCWVSEYEALPDMDSNANAVAINKIVIENEDGKETHPFKSLQKHRN